MDIIESSSISELHIVDPTPSATDATLAKLGENCHNLQYLRVIFIF